MNEAATKNKDITKGQIVEMEDVVNDLANAVIQNVMSSKWEGNPVGLCSGISIRIASEVCLHVMMGDTVEDLLDEKEFNKVLGVAVEALTSGMKLGRYVRLKSFGYERAEEYSPEPPKLPN